MKRIVAVAFAILIAIAAGSVRAQTQDDFAYWDQNGNGDLTCSEADNGPNGDELRLPAYRDDRDGTGVIYEWLQRSRSSDTDNDGISCESTSNPNGYIPTVQPVEPQGCPADAEVWRGLQVCPEQDRTGYDRADFGSAYSSLEDEIIAGLPATMKAAGQVYTPYSCIAYDITANGTAATDIEHIVALAEAHDSGIADGARRTFASDLDNLTIADPAVNSRKSDRDAGGWTPDRHGAWFAARVVAVKREYGLSVDPAERDALEALFGGGGAALSCVDADTTSPSVSITTDVTGTVNGPFTIDVRFSESVTGFEISDLSVTNGAPSNLGGAGGVYTATVTPTSSGAVTVQIPAGVATDASGNANTAGPPLTVAADLDAPYVEIRLTDETTPPTGPTGPFGITISFSEPVIGFENHDVMVTNGTASDLAGVEDVYTATIAPAPEADTVTVQIAAGAATDAAGNPNGISEPLAVPIDRTPVPALPVLAAVVLGALLVRITFWQRRHRH